MSGNVQEPSRTSEGEPVPEPEAKPPTKRRNRRLPTFRLDASPGPTDSGDRFPDTYYGSGSW